MSRVLTALLLFSPALSSAQDGAQVARLEQEVRQLQREVLTLSQLVTQLRMRVEREAPVAAVPPAGLSRQAPAEERKPAASDLPAPRWINRSAWRSLRTGMSELEVIAALGPPTSSRGVDPERTLFYALEIGPASFLAGSVTLRDHAVTAIETPTLK